MAQTTSLVPSSVGSLAKIAQSPEAIRHMERLLGAYDTLLERYMPPLILVDAQGRVVDSFADANRFLRFSGRRPSQDVTELLLPSLRSAVTAALQQCSASGQAVLTDPIELDDVDDASPSQRDAGPCGGVSRSWCFRVRVAAVPHVEGESPYFSIAIEDSATAPQRSAEIPRMLTEPDEQGGDVATTLVREAAPSQCQAEHRGGSTSDQGGGPPPQDELVDSSLLEASGFGLILLDKHLRIESFSHAAAAWFDFRPHDTGRHIRTFAGVFNASDFVDRLTGVLRTGDADEFEVDQEGELRRFLVRVHPQRSGDPSSGLAVTLIDLSSTEQRQREIRHLSSIVESSADAIISRDCDDRITSWNDAAEQLYGYSAGEAIGQPIGMIIPDSESDELANSQRAIRRDAYLNHFDSSRKTKSGGTIRVSVRMSPVFDEENRLVGISTIERDVSDQVELMRRLSQSEQLFQAFYHQSPEMYCSIDLASGLVTDCNESMIRQLGMSREDIVGHSVLDLQTESFREQARCCIDRLRESGMLHGEELELRRGDGGTIPVSLCAMAVHDTSGRLIGARGVWRDMTALRVKDELIRRSEARYYDTFQTSAIGIAHCDLDGRYILANRRLCEIVGYPFEELSQRTFHDITHPDDLPRELEMRRRLIAQELDTYQLEKRYLHRTGHEVWVSIFVSLERAESGSPIACHSYVEDISARKELEGELRQAIQQRDQFLAMLSHELRNPLGAILNTCAVLARRKGLGKGVQNEISIVTRQARQMAELLDDLLDVSRITTGKIKLEKTPLELARVVDEAVESQQSLAQSRGQSVVVSYCDDPLIVFGDRSRLVQVVVNLLNNAIKYSSDGDLIAIALEKKGRVGRIVVRDNGVGLDPGQIESLFEMFAQKDATLDRASGGMGLGLHLVRKLVDFHSGRVLGSSKGLGQGSEFAVELPLSGRRSRSLAGKPTPRPPRAARPRRANKVKRIVVVEDIDDARKMLVALLEADNYEVSSAADGEAGLQMILNKRPELAIVDIGLPKLDGYQVARHVRQVLSPEEIRLIALTGYGQESDHQRVIDAGFDTHLVKPLNHGRLEKILAGG